MSQFWEIRQGDALDRLREMPDESVQCCVTSPPYWGLRDYGVDGQLGLEETPEQFVAAMVEVFVEVRRVLRADGTLWLNIGDSYWSAKGTPGGEKAWRDGSNADEKNPARRFGKRPQDGPAPAGSGIKPKDLVGIPWMLAFALRADGWYLRRDIIWAKPNPMPESVTDRPTSAHEYLFLLTKSVRYFYDADAIREQWADHRNGDSGARGTYADDAGRGGGGDKSLGTAPMVSGRNKRSVWTIATKPYSAAHFATFPPKLVEPCIKAGTSPKVCGECGAQWLKGDGPRRLDPSRPQSRRALALADEHGLTDAHIEAIRICGIGDAGKAQHTQAGFGNNDPQAEALAAEAKDALGGYYREFLLARPSAGALEPNCDHADDSGRAVVLDPFCGAATTGLVALRHERSFIGIELNPEYVELGRNRLRDDAPLLNVPAEVQLPSTAIETQEVGV